MSLLCIDIGNTHTHYGVVVTGATSFQRAMPTRLLDDARDGLGPALAQILAGHPAIEGAAFCSVVPAATEKLQPLLAALKLPRPVFELTYDKKLGVRIG
jgi:type III pantothenate kinase